MKAIWLRQPYPTLIEIGVKQWETRGGPPNGPMRPDGVRGMPGLAIEPGERIAIVASVNRPVGVRELGEWVMFHGGGLVPVGVASHRCRAGAVATRTRGDAWQPPRRLRDQGDMVSRSSVVPWWGRLLPWVLAVVAAGCLGWSLGIDGWRLWAEVDR